MHHFTNTRLIPLALAALALTACGGGGDDAPIATDQAVALDFAAYSGTTPVSCGTAVTGLGTGATTAQIKDFRFYISGVKLIRADGSTATLKLGANDDWNHTNAAGESVTLIDLENGTGSCATGTAATNTTLRGTVPVGTYVGVEMQMGVPFSLNHTDTAVAPKPLDNQAMTWSWQAGRKFAKIEVTDPAGTPGTWSANTFNFHLGSTGCVGNPALGATVACSVPNRMAFHFHSFNPASQKIAVDVQALVAGLDVTRNLAGSPGCMSGGTDPECLNVFQALAIDWKADGTGTGQVIDEGHAQTLFKAVAK